MSPADESELHRISSMLGNLYAGMPADSPLREGLYKAGVALSWAFMEGRRKELEEHYDCPDAPLTPAQRDHLLSMGIDPDAGDVEDLDG